MEERTLTGTFIVLLMLVVISMSTKAHASSADTIDSTPVAKEEPKVRPQDILLNCDHHKDDDVISLACNMYWEANTQGIKGMLAVAAVTLARVNHSDYPNTVRGVVWERRFIKGKYRPQFSWTLDGKPDLVTIYGRTIWEKALRLARIFAVPREQEDKICAETYRIRDVNKRMWDMLEEQGVSVTRHEIPCESYHTLMKSKAAIADEMDPTHGALFYHADYIEPWWTKPKYELIRTVQIRNHIFYRPPFKKVAYSPL